MSICILAEMQFHAYNFGQKGHKWSNSQYLTMNFTWCIMFVQTFMLYQEVHNLVIFYEYMHAPLICQHVAI